MKKLATLVIAFFLLLFIAAFFYAYTLFEQSLIEADKEKERQTVELIKTTLKAAKIDNIENTKNTFSALLKSSYLEAVAFELESLSFHKETLFKLSGVLDESWSLADVSCDANFGEIESDKDGVYTLNQADSFEKKEPLVVRFSAYKGGVIRDFRVEILFAFALGEIDKTQEMREIKDANATLTYQLGHGSLDLALQKLREQFFYGSALLLLGIFGFFYLYVVIVKKKEFQSSLEDLDSHLETLLSSEFHVEESQKKPKEFQNIYAHIEQLSKNFATVLNELNVTRDIIEKREITDDLTGLPNKKWFEKDMKQMFITNKDGYIIFFKIDQLGEFAKKHGSEIVNSLVEDFAKTIESYFATNRVINGRCYRFFGAEFALIIYESDVQKVKNTLDEIIELTKTLDDKYYFFDNQIYYGGTPFDKYGTVESILQSAKDEYSGVYAKKERLYSILDQSEQIEKNRVLEDSVKDIIERDDFALQYVFDTYDFSEPPHLIMQEISPMLIDMRTFDRFPIGVFISVAEKMDIAMEFDKLLIKKALSHIEMAELEHLIAINLSVGAISSMRFLSWLSSTLTYEKNASSLVFVVTAYNAAANYELYRRFVETARSFEIKIMIKRYDANDLSLERLQEISPEYIRIERDYCNDLKRDTTKQHAIKQVLFVAEESNIKVLGDGVKSDADYTTIERLGFYGTSR